MLIYRKSLEGRNEVMLIDKVESYPPALNKNMKNCKFFLNLPPPYYPNLSYSPKSTLSQDLKEKKLHFKTLFIINTARICQNFK